MPRVLQVHNNCGGCEAQGFKAMSQEAGRHECPVPAGGFEVFADRRRHTYAGFRPPLNGQDSGEHQHNEDSEQLELEDVQKENSLASCEDSSSMVQVPSGLSDDPLIKNAGTGEQVCQSISNHTVDVDTLPLSFFSCGLEGNQYLGNFMNLHENSEDLAEYMSGMCNDLDGQNAIACVNIDSYEPDSSDGDDDAEDQLSLVRDEAGIFQKTLDNMLPDLDNVTDYCTDLQSQYAAFGHSCSEECCKEAEPMPLVRYFSIDSHLACSNNRTVKFSAEDGAILKSDLSGASYETQQTEKRVDVGDGTPVVEANELNASGMKTDLRNPPELVVRPKIRKQNTANQLEGNKHPNVDEEESGSCRITEIAEVQGHTACALRNSKDEMSSSMFFDSGEYQDHQRNTDVCLSRRAAAQEQKNILGDSTSGNEFEDFSRHFSVSHKDEDSSECSDGEWCEAMPACSTATERGWSSSNDSWETVPFVEECKPEAQNSSSGEEEKSKEFSFQGREQTLLEEEEMPWLQEEPESSSDEEDNSTSDFLHPGLLLGENNNLEDDSSVGEDLDVVWRLLDEFGDGLGLAQAIPYMDSPFLTFMALEEHLQQAMETALAHLESLGFDMEQAHPPASKETIDSLPQILVTDDHDGQEQCCTICCSEYVKDEVITELPCHHLFHKLCVTLWLQKSGTCPVCRYVLASVTPEAAADSASSSSDHDSASSVHSATEGSN
ncbi:E3 ubiquitin-protein ligase Praja-2 [Phaenicophaeus curvirostris]|uniref:E3 ubiquitin-protein ligase Praja-2 n=1 Tax=Phaenicophaeus curvirostris TaxID=33595 RepID=UPI0037F0EDEA